jgi:hypothetical protein
MKGRQANPLSEGIKEGIRRIKVPFTEFDEYRQFE